MCRGSVYSAINMAPVEIAYDYYEILEVDCKANEAAIKTSYRRLARARHPDKDPDNPNATAEFQLVSGYLLCPIFLVDSPTEPP